ncbi:M16 family metallopeptidase [Microbaculum marinisediminis]|uniref:Insulinase family protein n=1 Tax=Microbaculum marinisediminis TaxID=2931392 RepID=A0AAW5QUR0_9HYPH|nr:pitrilysin family protein [Microbaculum sp. A6E488]MCT8970388.1 insulinase family protein [Microbaculum sp. A6E488]
MLKSLVWKFMTDAIVPALAVATVATVATTAAVRPASAIEIEKVVSPGGIEAWLVSESAVPLVSVQFAFDGGAAQDPPDRPGVANLISVLLDEGAGDIDSAAFQEKLESLAIEMSFDAGRDTFYGAMQTLTENLDEAANLLRLAITAPRFDADAIERMRVQTESGLRRELTDPNAVAGRLWSDTVFGSHPYGRPVKGTLETVAAITVDDLRAYHERIFARDTLKIAVVGDITAERLAPLLDEIFGGLPQTADLAPVAEATLPDGGMRKVVEMEIPQTVIQFGRPGLKRDDPDFIPAYVVNHILGGGAFSSRLYQEVREKRGLSYSVYSFLYPLDRAGLIAGGAATRNDRAAESLAIIDEEIKRMADEGPTAEELDKAKRYLKGSYPLRFDTSTKIARQLVEIQRDKLGIDYINKRNDLIDAVTIDDAKRVARKLYGDGSLYVTMVGRPDGIAADAKGG